MLYVCFNSLNSETTDERNEMVDANMKLVDFDHYNRDYLDKEARHHRYLANNRIFTAVTDEELNAYRVDCYHMIAEFYRHPDRYTHATYKGDMYITSIFGRIGNNPIIKVDERTFIDAMGYIYCDELFTIAHAPDAVTRNAMVADLASIAGVSVSVIRYIFDATSCA